MIIKVDSKPDREALALILIKNGYRVRITTANSTSGKRITVIEYEEVVK